MMSENIPPLSPSLTASLLFKTVVKERKGDEGNRFKVRVLFHMRGDPNQGTCVTLHAFKQTEEQKASCITQVLLGYFKIKAKCIFLDYNLKNIDFIILTRSI